jgi:hypothetical protein
LIGQARTGATRASDKLRHHRANQGQAARNAQAAKEIGQGA